MADAHEDFVQATTFLYPWEADVSRGLLQSSGILCYLENENALRMVWAWNTALGGLRLMVPASELPLAREVLREQIAEAQTIAAPNRIRAGVLARLVLAIAILSSPAVYSLQLIFVS